MIAVTGLDKSFGTKVVLSGISFRCPSRAICSFVGPSGCGKTTLLNILAGLDRPDSGSFSIGAAHGDEASVAYMMQDALLLPWRTLIENALLGTELRNSNNRATLSALNSYFATFDLSDYMHHYPDASSGGMKQRVALIRTLLTKPSYLLLDEPFSNLDFDIKLKIQRHLIDYHRKEETTIVLVTHDIEDAIALSDKVVILSDKPTSIKLELPIELGTARRDPVEARKSPRFRDYFVRIWDELKYLDDTSGGA